MYKSTFVTKDHGEIIAAVFEEDNKEMQKFWCKEPDDILYQCAFLEENDTKIYYDGWTVGKDPKQAMKSFMEAFKDDPHNTFIMMYESYKQAVENGRI